MTKKIITIDVIADLVCPWCFIGRKRVLKAIQLLDNADIFLKWKPFLLSPQMPEKGKSYQLHMKSVFGSQDLIDENERTLITLGHEDDIEFDFAAITVVPNTLNAHRALYWALQDSVGTQDQLAGELFSRYFEQGQNIGHNDIIVEAVNEVGMRGDVVEKLLATKIDSDTIKQDVAQAQAMGVQGVPCFIVDKKFVVMGAQPVEVLADTIQQIADGFEPNISEDR